MADAKAPVHRGYTVQASRPKKITRRTSMPSTSDTAEDIPGKEGSSRLLARVLTIRDKHRYL